MLTSSDQYTSPKIIKLKELEDEKAKIDELPKKNAQQKKRLDDIEQEMIPLTQFLADAKLQRAQIRSEIGMLQSYFHPIFNIYCLDSLKADPSKVVIVLDFTKFGMVDEGNVHCFVVTLLSRGSNEDAKLGKLLYY